MSKRIVEIYRGMMETAGLFVDEHGHVFNETYTADGTLKLKAHHVQGKSLVLPTKQNLMTDTESTTRFNPLMENLSAGESAVVSDYRKVISGRINMACFELIYDLLRLVADKASHEKVDPNYGDVLSILSGSVKSTYEDFEAIATAMMKQGQGRGFVKFYMKKNGKIGTVTVKRLAVVSFPVYESLVNGENPYGVEVGKRNRLILIKAFRYVFPDIDEPQAYSYGSMSKMAPIIDSLMGAVSRVYSAIGAKQNIFGQMELGGDLFQNQLVYKHSWSEDFADIDELSNEIRLIPAQPGNEGALPSDLANEVKEVVAPKAPLSVGIPANLSGATTSGVIPTATPPWESPPKPVSKPAEAPKRLSTFAEDIAAARQSVMSAQPFVQAGLQWQQAQELQRVQQMQMFQARGPAPVHINPYMQQQQQNTAMNSPYPTAVQPMGGFNKSPY